ncbi:uncharacterized protein DC041_0004567 [Schistosoma bovis]|uniref:Junctophilin n=1 Tax=Schistosoma bovis TaxID=6184 RepID=A0A430PXP9_SCHBO|nr:uncharacterized protein DC041_0004567 [Schistosoma bovis]
MYIQVDAIDPETVETFAGQWEADSRHGYGVCERSDGVIYEGQWVKNQRHGYGQTHFPDGVCEQGKYQNARDYSLETRELVKEMYPDFEQPGIKYLEDMVRLMNITKRGNQAFDTALQSAKDVIATVEANLIEHNQSQEQNLEENHEQNDLNYPSLDLDPMKPIQHNSGIPLSRAGSYLNVDCSFSQQINNDKSILNNKFPSPTMTTTSENSLHVPNLNYYTNRIDNDISSECDSIEGESRTTRSSSEASNYVILPTFNILKPQTEPLTIPLE